MIIKPKRDILLIQADPAVTQTASGILLNESWKTLPLEGTVLAIGPEVKSIKVGDRVGFNRYASTILPDDQRLCQERQVLWGC